MKDESVRIGVYLQECRLGRPHIGHLWIPLPSLTHAQYLPSEAIRYCEGEKNVARIRARNRRGSVVH